MINPDEYNPEDFGIEVVGTFDSVGMPTGFTVAFSILSNKFPRYLEKEPVLYVSHDKYNSVYIRGLYSGGLTKCRIAALAKAKIHEGTNPQ